MYHFAKTSDSNLFQSYLVKLLTSNAFRVYIHVNIQTNNNCYLNEDETFDRRVAVNVFQYEAEIVVGSKGEAGVAFSW